MFAYIKGAVLAKKDKYLILLVQDSVGYRVYTTAHVLESTKVNDDLYLYLYTHVREDALELYGFPTPDELEFFERLISISNVGPKLALGVLSVAPLADIKKAIIHGDPALLQRVSSVGKKTAERIIVELKEKISVTPQEETIGLSITENVQLHDALLALGYRETEIRKVMQQIPTETGDLSDKIREALKILSTPQN